MDPAYALVHRVTSCYGPSLFGICVFETVLGTLFLALLAAVIGGAIRGLVWAVRKTGQSAGIEVPETVEERVRRLERDYSNEIAEVTAAWHVHYRAVENVSGPSNDLPAIIERWHYMVLPNMRDLCPRLAELPDREVALVFTLGLRAANLPSPKAIGEALKELPDRVRRRMRP